MERLRVTDSDLYQLPADTRHTMQRLLAQPVVPLDSLRLNVQQYMQLVYHAATIHEFIDVATAERLAETSYALLDSVAPQAPGDTRALIQAAVRYFLVSEDADDDLASISGFDDDVAVMNAVTQMLGRPDLQIPIP
jgi:uncharacterized membrane protein YkvA (DUF1232 family)